MLEANLFWQPRQQAAAADCQLASVAALARFALGVAALRKCGFVKRPRRLRFDEKRYDFRMLLTNSLLDFQNDFLEIWHA